MPFGTSTLLTHIESVPAMANMPGLFRPDHVAGVGVFEPPRGLADTRFWGARAGSSGRCGMAHGQCPLAKWPEGRPARRRSGRGGADTMFGLSFDTQHAAELGPQRTSTVPSWLWRATGRLGHAPRNGIEKGRTPKLVHREPKNTTGLQLRGNGRSSRSSFSHRRQSSTPVRRGALRPGVPAPPVRAGSGLPAARCRSPAAAALGLAYNQNHVRGCGDRSTPRKRSPLPIGQFTPASR